MKDKIIEYLRSEIDINSRELDEIDAKLVDNRSMDAKKADEVERIKTIDRISQLKRHSYVISKL